MSKFELPDSLFNLRIHFTGIKGTGMAALAELFLKKGADIYGSDTTEKFYTDEILTSLEIPYKEGFAEENVDKNCDLLVYSSAYSPDEHSEILAAKAYGIPVMEYAEALGLISSFSISCGITGVHGKTTTTAIAGTIVKKLGLPVSVLVGSSVSTFGDRSTLNIGDKYFIAETCEYKRAFLHFSPSKILLTSIEPDHLDFYKDYNDILNAFISYGMKLPVGGDLIYCADDSGAVEAAKIISQKRPDIKIIPYGEKADGDFKITETGLEPGKSFFRLAGFEKRFKIRIPGKHILLDSAGAAALACSLLKEEYGIITDLDIENISAGLLEFAGSRRRFEIIGETDGILFIDDYAHHPTAISKTLEGIKIFYPDRRIIADFMSHTYSRTSALFDDFSKSFGSADIIILHKIYSSAREKKGNINGYDLYKKTCESHGNVKYFEEVMDAEIFCKNTLRNGDLFITMGAGDNWILGKKLYSNIFEKGKSI